MAFIKKTILTFIAAMLLIEGPLYAIQGNLIPFSQIPKHTVMVVPILKNKKGTDTLNLGTPCSGVVVTAHYVLTAAHCVRNPAIETILIVFVPPASGLSPMLKTPATNITRNPASSPDVNTDIGVGKNTQGVLHDVVLIYFNDVIPVIPVRLPIHIREFFPENNKLDACLLIGNRAVSSPTELPIVAGVVAQFKVLQRYPYFELSLQTNAAISEEGDSGGPLVCKTTPTSDWTLWGTIIAGTVTGSMSYVEPLYVNMPWIASITHLPWTRTPYAADLRWKNDSDTVITTSRIRQ